MLKKRIALFTVIVLTISTLAVMVSAAPIVKDITSARISAVEAEDIALKSVGLTRDGIRFERTEIDYERGKLVWEVEFEKGNTEYSFEIDAATGKIVREKVEQERKPSAPPATEPPVTEPPITEPPVTESPITEPPATQPTATGITREEAIEIALANAGLTRDEVRELEVERDYEYGILVYEVEFEYGRTEYDYEIRVSDGKILRSEADIDD